MPGKQKTKQKAKREPKVKRVSGVVLDYKKPEVLKRFLSSRYKLMPKKSTGLSSKDQRKLRGEVKKARIMGLLPFTDRHAIR